MSNKKMTKNRILKALIAMRNINALSTLHDALIQAEKDIQNASAESICKIDELVEPKVYRALKLYFAGYFDKPVRSTSRDNGPSAKPDDTSGLTDLGSPTCLPSDDEISDALLDNSSYQPMAGTETTFLFLADPQVSRAQHPKDNNNPRVKMMDGMNKVLNRISSQTWPTGFGLDPTIVGTAIKKPEATFFGGDLCQTGGDYNFLDQFASEPADYRGGFELEMIRRLFDNGPWGLSKEYPSEGLTKLNAGRVFYGLGNHDVQSEYHPDVGWFQGCLRWSTPTDYWRWQMWNFICQKHRGVFTNCIFNWASTPTAAPTSMDAMAPYHNEVNYWTKRSLDYMVDLGPVDVYQLHVFGGDTQHGRASGMHFLRKTLAKRGTTRPVIIVQHYDFSSFSIPGWWTTTQRDALLTELEPYNVVAFLMGHDHSALTSIPLRQPYPGSSPKVAEEFRPGSAGVHGNFAILHIEGNSFNIMQGSGANGVLTWNQGFSKTI